MNIKLNFLGLLAFITLLSSCIKEGEVECPTIRIRFYAEKFQNKSQNPLDDREQKFCDRINHVRYYLYKENQLIEEQVIDKMDNTASDCFTLQYDNLDHGNYELVVVGNSTKAALTGDPFQSSNLLITYSGCSDTEDYFSAVFPFTVNSNESKEYEVGLLRAHGVVRYTFLNMPENITDFEVFMTNVGLEKWITSDYKNVVEATQRFRISPSTRQETTDMGYVIGTFPTATDQRSAFTLNLYSDGAESPYFSRMISDTLSVTRNQLLDIVTTFNDGNVSFEVILDNDWNGSLPGAEVEIQR